jgi:deoxyribonuclease I
MEGPVSKTLRQAVLIPLVLLCLGVWTTWTQAAPPTFERAKIELRQHVYQDRNTVGTFYCGCRWEWVGRSGGRVDFASCGYEIRAQEHRAIRTEWEHILPASSFGRQRLCWQEGGRSNCNRTDPVFNAMEADMHNLTPSVGEINADRSNYRFGMLPGGPKQHGACEFRVDFQARVAEPRAEIRGQIARVYFYMHDRYDLRMSHQQQQLMMAWHAQHPPSEWEIERDRRIAAIMGHHNPFVTGERAWALGHRNTADGVVSEIPAGHPALGGASRPESAPIRGNRNSRIYHLPSGCLGYGQIAEQNVIEFSSEADAIAAGYRRAGNCR